MIRRAALAIAIAVLAATTGCRSSGPTDQPPGDWSGACPTRAGGAPRAATPDSTVQTIATGLCVPWGLAFLPDGTALVGERDTARLLSIAVDGRVTEVQRFADVRPGGRPPAPGHGGEGGLLGLAVSPTYRTDKWVYAYYATEQDNRIVRFHLGETPQPILTGIPANDANTDAASTKPNARYLRAHHGGRIAFGPDGMLYAGTGETYYTPNLAQDRNSLGGKILRMTPDGKPAPGNPFPDSVVYSLGHRNVQGLAWDSTGRLYASEFGLHDYDELNLIRADANYGWPVVEGPSQDSRFVNPTATWHPTSSASPSGIAIVGNHIYVPASPGNGCTGSPSTDVPTKPSTPAGSADCGRSNRRRTGRCGS